jgi:hypothetical protein
LLWKSWEAQEGKKKKISMLMKKEKNKQPPCVDSMTAQGRSRRRQRETRGSRTAKLPNTVSK